MINKYISKKWNMALSSEYSCAMKSEFRYSESPILCLMTYSFLLGYWSRPCRICGAQQSLSMYQQKLWFDIDKNRSKKWFPYHRTADVKPSGIFNIALSLALTEFCARTLNSLACSLVKCPCEFTLSRFARWVICMEAISFGEGESFNKE